VIDSGAMQQRQEEELQQRRAEQQRQAELEQQRQAEQEQQRQAELEQQRRREAELERQQAERERAEQAKLEAERKAEAQRVAEQKRVAEEKRKAEEQRKAEAERKRAEEARVAEQQRIEAQRQAEFRAGLEAEEQLLAAVASGAQAQYIALIRSQVERNWVRPAGATAGIECVVHVTQAPGGYVRSARVGKCNGDQAVERSIVAAVEKSSPLPTPADPRLFERNLRFTFKPEQ
ncbi:MAG: cell envelope integrity protein TolA, partial [Gammaproteobacteria bacterium]